MQDNNKTTLQDRQKIRDMANQLFARERDAHKWLNRPNERLDGGRPADFMRTKTGAARVEKLLADEQRWFTFNH